MYIVYYCDNVKSAVKKFEKLEDAEMFVKTCQEQRRSWQYGDWFIEYEEVNK